MALAGRLDLYAIKTQLSTPAGRCAGTPPWREP